LFRGKNCIIGLFGGKGAIIVENRCSRGNNCRLEIFRGNNCRLKVCREIIAE